MILLSILLVVFKHAILYPSDIKISGTLGVIDGAVIRAKLKQGNGRGTCCWSTHNIHFRI